jgi:WD40 repeat protein
MRVWDTVSAQCVRVIQGYAPSLYDIDWSPDATQLVSGGTDAVVTIYSIAGGARRALHGHSGIVIGVGWSSKGQWIASSEWDNTIRLWDPISGSCLQILHHPDDTDNYLYGLAWSPDGQQLASATFRRGVQVWDMTMQRYRWQEHQFPTWIRRVAWSPDGQRLAGGGDDGAVYIWDAQNGALLHRLAEHHSMITSITWSPDGELLASASGGMEAGELFVWDSEKAVRIASIVEPSGLVSATAWGANRNVVISGSGDGILRWWDLQSEAPVMAREAHRGTVQALRRSPDGQLLASCGDGGAIVLWDIESGEALQTLRRDRPYERVNITGIRGLTDAQKATLRTLGAIEYSAG